MLPCGHCTDEESPMLDELNPEQLAAAQHGDGPLLIVAGAGTGKTATLVHRVAHLISRGADPRRILLLTFTRRAAAEMLRRVNVSSRMRRGSAPRLMRCATRCTSVAVLPVPAPATMSSGPSPCFAAASCSGLSSSSMGGPPFGAVFAG